MPYHFFAPSSHVQFVTLCEVFTNLGTPYFSATPCKYSHISGAGAQNDDQDGFGAKVYWQECAVPIILDKMRNLLLSQIILTRNITGTTRISVFPPRLSDPLILLIYQKICIAKPLRNSDTKIYAGVACSYDADFEWPKVFNWRIFKSERGLNAISIAVHCRTMHLAGLQSVAVSLSSYKLNNNENINIRPSLQRWDEQPQHLWGR